MWKHSLFATKTQASRRAMSSTRRGLANKPLNAWCAPMNLFKTQKFVFPEFCLYDLTTDVNIFQVEKDLPALDRPPCRRLIRKNNPLDIFSISPSLIPSCRANSLNVSTPSYLENVSGRVCKRLMIFGRIRKLSRAFTNRSRLMFGLSSRSLSGSCKY